ncbi:hypothetical protein [Exiguobacterium sp. RIT594]|uniref:hypothetical protein n=1 Tax=Exiguobacterium sp. RIT594 TaxID=2282449 RepID=UPI001F3231D9|nr:hypothetical protein [Exiguobacterium sp. RIT594]
MRQLEPRTGTNIRGANHSLDIDFEVDQSLQVLGQIMQRTEDVLFPVPVKEN